MLGIKTLGNYSAISRKLKLLVLIGCLSLTGISDFSQTCSPGSGSGGRTPVGFQIQTKFSGAGGCKEGFHGYTDPLWPYQGCYLNQHTHIETSYSSSSTTTYDSNNNINCGTAGPGTVWNINTGSRTVDRFESFDGTPDAIYTNYYTGGDHTYLEGGDSRHRDWHCEGDLCPLNWHIDNYLGITDISGTPQYLDNNGNPGWWWVTTETDTSNFAWVEPGCGGPPTYTTNVWSHGNSAIVINEIGFIRDTSTDPELHEEDHLDPVNGGTGSWYHTLSGPYTDQMLWNNIYGVMPAYPSEWHDGADIAFSLIWSGHWCNDIEPNYLGKMKYRIGVPAKTDPGAVYLIKWKEIMVIAPENTWNVIGEYSEYVTGTGSETEPAWTSEHERIPPPFHGGGDTGLLIVYLSDVEAEQVKAAGPAGTGGWSASIACASCGGRSKDSVEGLSADFSLGHTLLGDSAGKLNIYSHVPTLSLASPAALKRPEGLSGLEFITNTIGLRQVKGPQTLADIVTNNPFSYEIRYYLPSQVGSPVSGIYTVSGSPFVTWKVENPDASTTTYNRVRLTETRGSQSWVYDATYTETNKTWKFDWPDGLMEKEVTAVDVDAYGTRQVTTVIRKQGGQDVQKVRRTYKRFSWAAGSSGVGSQASGAALVEETLDPDGNPKTTTWDYLDSTDYQYGPPLHKVIHPDGSWDQYTYDSYGRIATLLTGLGDSIDTGGDYKITTFRYGDWADGCVYGSGDDGSLETNSVRCVTTTVNGNIIEQQFTAIPSADTRIEVQATLPYSAWDDPSNLFTTNHYYTSGANFARLKSVVRPDKTLQTFNYADDPAGFYRTNMTATGVPNGTFTAVVDGTSNYIVLNIAGEPLIDQVMDVLTGTILSRSVATNFDDLGRAGRITYLDGTHEDKQYACCGIDNIMDRDGVITQYFYDASKRQVAQSRLNVLTTNILDGSGRTIKTLRIGTDATQVTLSQLGYNLAGTLVNQTNGLGGITTVSETRNSLGALVRTTTYPDGGTRVETNYVDGQIKSITGTAVHGLRYEYGYESYGATGDSDDNYQRYAKEIKLNTDGSDSSEWTRTYTDIAGRVYKTMYSDGTPSNLTDNPYEKSWYNNKGQLWKQRDADGVVTLFAYNAKGEREYAAIDVDSNDAIDFAGLDRVSRTTNCIVSAHGTSVLRSESYTFPTDSLGSAYLLKVSETSVDGLQSWQTTYRDASTPVTSVSKTVYFGSSSRYETNTAPDGSYSLTVYSNGRLDSITRKDSAGVQISSSTYSYDPHGHQSSATDARNGSTVYGYNSGDMVSSVTTPSPGTLGGQPQTTLTYYDSALRTTNVVNSDGSRMTNEYFVTGELKKTYGSRTYPVEYTYDYAGRVKTMKTWQNFAGNSGTATTTWNYDAYRGWLTNKRYADSTGPDYTYTAAGRMKTRTWARTGTGGNRIVTTYNYGIDDGNANNDHGDLVSVSYSNDPLATAGITYTYDRRGRQKTVVQGSMTTALAYNDANQLLYEKYTGGTLDSLGITNAYDTYLRRTAGALSNQTSTLVTYTYDNASRLSSVGNGSYNATYSYIANSPLVSQIVFKQSSTTRMTTSKGYDYLNRLTSISSTTNASSAPAFSFGYFYNDANQRTRMNLADGSFWIYEYDSLGQVKSGKRFWPDWTPVAGQQFEYGFDDIGNRKSTKAGGDQNGLNLRSATYGANNLNQYTNRDVPGAVDVMGIVLGTNTVTVNGSAPYRKGEYFRQEVTAANSSTSVWQNVSVAATGETTVNGNVYVPKTKEVFSYDLDGNLTNDGRWAYSWDAENRLVRMVANTSIGATNRIDFGYDCKSRRIAKRVWNNKSGTGNPTNDLKFVYDGWNLIASLNATNSAVVQSFAWGTDLSGLPQGAGGVGGLVALNDSANGTCFASFDGNGNVVSLVKGGDGSIWARYEYAPFGEVVRATGPMAKTNPVRFSTKYQDDETDLLYYGYRYLSASIGRWLNTDPLAERAGPTLIAFARNNAINLYDVLGELHANQQIQVSYKGEAIGNLEVVNYRQQPFPLNVDRYGFVGAILEIYPHIGECECCSYKWRQHFTEKRDQTYVPADELRRVKNFRYLPKSYLVLKDVLDVDYDKPPDGIEWYGRHPDDCTYNFRDQPSKVPPDELWTPGAPPAHADRWTVEFKLEFVRLAGSNRGKPSGGEPLVTVEWGYWATSSEHGVLNKDK
jgi:RHS repeat-associated protein